METKNKLATIQEKLKVPKNQLNKFGNYKYRSCEDIVEAVKPLCVEQGLTLNLSDEVVEIGGRVYVKATASIKENGKIVDSSTGFAREEETKKGMDASQITGAASSYARKYALNGLFGIDDTKDADDNGSHQNGNGHDAHEKEFINPKNNVVQDFNKLTKPEKKEDTRPWLSDIQFTKARDRIGQGELDVYKQTIDAFRMKREYRKTLDEVYEFSKSLA